MALTLQTMCGLPTSAIARLFMVPEATVAQRLVRAKRKIRDSGIPYEVPAAEQLDERLEPVLAVVYLYFTEGYASSDGAPLVRSELCEEAIRLGRVLCHLLPRHPEVRGLLALMLLHHARRATRTDSAGDIVALEDQDRSRWDGAMVAEGTRQLDEALGHGRPGPYQIQAAIAALHCGARRAQDTDWPQIAGLYRELFRRLPSPAVAVGLCIAEGMPSGPETGLAHLAAFVEDGTLAGSDRLMAARADLLRPRAVSRSSQVYFEASPALAKPGSAFSERAPPFSKNPPDPGPASLEPLPEIANPGILFPSFATIRSPLVRPTRHSGVSRPKPQKCPNTNPQI